MKICDKCGQPEKPFQLQPSGRRICAECFRPVQRHDKWFTGVDGRVHHRDCKKPSGYPVEETMELAL